MENFAGSSLWTMTISLHLNRLRRTIFRSSKGTRVFNRLRTFHVSAHPLRLCQYMITFSTTIILIIPIRGLIRISTGTQHPTFTSTTIITRQAQRSLYSPRTSAPEGPGYPSTAPPKVTGTKATTIPKSQATIPASTRKTSR